VQAVAALTVGPWLANRLLTVVRHNPDDLT